MVSRESIFQAAEVLRQTASPRRIILFGSYARGDANEDSDVDMLVLEEGDPDVFGEMVRLRAALSPLRIPVDLIVAGEKYYDYWCDTPGNLMFEIALEGQVLYEAA